MSAAARTQRTPRDLLIIGAITATILLMIPLMAVMGLAIQFGFVIALPLAVLALLITPLLMKARAPGQTQEVQGIALPADAYLHERHGWARRAKGGRYRVGADALLLNAFSAVDRVELPDQGTQVEQGEPLVTLGSGERQLTLKAPFSGTVQRVNQAAAKRADLLHDSPYDQGWLVELTPEAGVRSLDGLRHSSTARPWLTHEIDRMLQVLTGPRESTVLADGGQLTPGYAADLDDEDWSKLSTELF